MKSVTLKTEGTHCNACASRIKTLVEQLPGVQTASVSFEQAQVRILGLVHMGWPRIVRRL